MKEIVFARQKVLAKIYLKYGQDHLFDYVNGWQMPLPSPASGDLTAILERSLIRVYGADLAVSVIGSLRRQFLISTIDHHGLLNHPFFLNSNLLFSLRTKTPYLVCLTTAGVSLNNSSWPGCLVRTAKDGSLKRYSLYPDKMKTSAVLAVPPFSKENIAALMSRIDNEKELSPEEHGKLKGLVGKLFLDKQVLSQSDFLSQASLLSAKLWNRTFPEAPAVVYFPVEELVSDLMTEKIIKDSGNILHRLLFTVEGWDLVEKYFEGSLGAFSSGHKGSFLFWGIGEKGRRFRLCRQGKHLKGGDISLAADAQIIGQALADRKIYPTSLVCFLALLHYGATCLGGFNQVNWLTDIKDKFVSLLREAGENRLAEEIGRVPTENFAEANLAFLQKSGQLTKATGIDIFLSEDDQLYDKYRKLAETLTVGESIESLLPEIYRVITPAAERDDDLLSLTDEAVAEANGMAEKVWKALL